jgi:hypothetical protein
MPTIVTAMEAASGGLRAISPHACSDTPQHNTTRLQRHATTQHNTPAATRHNTTQHACSDTPQQQRHGPLRRGARAHTGGARQPQLYASIEALPDAGLPPCNWRSQPQLPRTAPATRRRRAAADQGARSAAAPPAAGGPPPGRSPTRPPAPLPATWAPEAVGAAGGGWRAGSWHSGSIHTVLAWVAAQGRRVLRWAAVQGRRSAGLGPLGLT